MKTISIIILTMAFTANCWAYNPLPIPGNTYGKGHIVAESKSTRHVQGREYEFGGNRDTGEGSTFYRRVLIYSKSSGKLIGYSKLHRELGDSNHRHRSSKH